MYEGNAKNEEWNYRLRENKCFVSIITLVIVEFFFFNKRLKFQQMPAIQISLLLTKKKLNCTIDE